jgi:enterochelin esterase-like enzyme
MIEIRGRCVTFLPPAGAVYLMGDFTDWDERPLLISRSQTLEFPSGAYVEYAFLDADGNPIADTSNSRRPKYPWYDYHRALVLPDNSFHDPPQPQENRGRVKTHEVRSSIGQASRRYWVYEPPTTPRTTLVVLDGGEYHGRLRFYQIAEALRERVCIDPLRMVFTEPVDRVGEYWLNERFEEFVLGELLPQVDQDYPKTPERAIWGASLGGLTAAWMAWRNPDVFGKAASQSGAFKTAPREGRRAISYYHDPEWLTELIAGQPRRPVRFYVDTGLLEWLLAPNRRFAAVLADKSYDHCYREHPGGHNWTTWEQGLEPGLRYLFGNR